MPKHTSIGCRGTKLGLLAPLQAPHELREVKTSMIFHFALGKASLEAILSKGNPAPEMEPGA
jgi:hypothetical protein